MVSLKAALLRTCAVCDPQCALALTETEVSASCSRMAVESVDAWWIPKRTPEQPGALVALRSDSWEQEVSAAACAQPRVGQAPAE